MGAAGEMLRPASGRRLRHGHACRVVWSWLRAGAPARPPRRAAGRPDRLHHAGAARQQPGQRPAEAETARPVCGERTEILKRLEQRHDEKPQALGLSADGGVLEILVSPEGGWTILVTYPKRPTCVVAVGAGLADAAAGRPAGLSAAGAADRSAPRGGSKRGPPPQQPCPWVTRSRASQRACRVVPTISAIVATLSSRHSTTTLRRQAWSARRRPAGAPAGQARLRRRGARRAAPARDRGSPPPA